jgi:hypothetical protein
MSIYRKDTLDMYRKGLDAGGTALYEMRKAEIAGLGARRGKIGKRVGGNIGETPARMFKAFEDINQIAAERRVRLAAAGMDEDGYLDISPSAEAGDQVHVNKKTSSLIPKYPEGLTSKKIEGIIRREAKLRNMDPEIAIKVYKSEGAGAYQSKIRSGSQKKEGGQEASYGPFQLYTGGGLGNQYEKETGRLLAEDNTLEGITTQIQFALDMAIDKGWSPWYGSKSAGVGARDGLDGATAVYNWRSENEDT